jgi:signal transduction histidine kinase
MKVDVNFGLESAGWPAFLVDGHAIIRKASQGGVSLFGVAVDSGTAHLASIWGQGNDTSAEQFLARPDLAAQRGHKIFFRGKGGTSVAFGVIVCPLLKEGQRSFVFQLLPEGMAGGSGSPDAAKNPPTATAKAVSTSRTNPPTAMLKALSSVEGGQPIAAIKAQLAEASQHKQKLDCALKLARTMALDFNNALTTILGHVSHVLAEMPPDHGWRRSLMEAEKAAERAAEIANDLATFSRQEKDARSQQAGNMNVLLRRAVEMFQKTGTTKTVIQWHLDLENRLYGVNFDEAKIQQAFVKIIENAAQSAGAQTGQGNIHVTCRNVDLSEPSHDQNANLAPGSYVCAEIRDDGAGIPLDVLPRVFEPFFTTKYGHRGLGLAWVYGIVTNHGGSVAISSDLGQGTSVRVYLPAVNKLVKEMRPTKLDVHGTETILMVDDEELLLTMGQMVLTSFGYKVITASSGQQALEIMQRDGDKIHLVITDLVMPQMSGRELAEKIRELYLNARILFVSGYVRPTGSGDEEDYLQKPFTTQQLVRKVKAFLTSGED